MGLWIQRYCVLKERVLYCRDFALSEDTGEAAVVVSKVPVFFAFASLQLFHLTRRSALLQRCFCETFPSRRTVRLRSENGSSESRGDRFHNEEVPLRMSAFSGAPTFCTSTRVRKGAESVLLFGFDVSASDGQTVKTLYAASLQERER